ncbi:response regulator [Luteibacter sp. CQ10]|uniref:response regulator n=1 Tax=Luteibacter sp. CQ10 TaxID=2805821 RepID=UPI0034A1D561
MATQRTILIVEDDDAIRELTAMLLEGEHAVHTARNGDEAAAWLDSNTPHVLFTDIRMPGKVTGQELAMRYWDSDVRVLVTSGERREDHPWLPAGMKYLAKPYDRRSLLATLRELL